MCQLTIGWNIIVLSNLFSPEASYNLPDSAHPNLQIVDPKFRLVKYRFLGKTQVSSENLKLEIRIFNWIFETLKPEVFTETMWTFIINRGLLNSTGSSIVSFLSFGARLRQNFTDVSKTIKMQLYCGWKKCDNRKHIRLKRDQRDPSDTLTEIAGLFVLTV
jgi:hypothetical protein